MTIIGNNYGLLIYLLHKLEISMIHAYWIWFSFDGITDCTKKTSVSIFHCVDGRDQAAYATRHHG